MKAWIYRGALLCEDCGAKLRAVLDTQRIRIRGEYPEGPYDNGGGEADSPQHCDHCGVFLENPLTEDGIVYVQNEAWEYADTGRGNPAVLREWMMFYERDWPGTLWPQCLTETAA